MANILSGKEIRNLIGAVLIDADIDHLNPNGIELRIGKDVLFHSTGEEKKLRQGMFLKVSPVKNVVNKQFLAPNDAGLFRRAKRLFLGR